jgi:hypothetical protein
LSQEPDAPPPEEPEYDPAILAAMARTNLPGIFLTLIGVLNLLVGIFFLYQGIRHAVRPADELWREVEEAKRVLPPVLARIMEEQNLTPEQHKAQQTTSNLVIAFIVLVSALVTIMGGLRMRGLQSYGLGVTGSILAAIPCLSPMGCCCGVAQFVGIWALVVLLDPNVRSTFE